MLFQPLATASLQLANRVVMAPMTRSLATPDLVERMRAGVALNAMDMATFYTPGPKGYTDYPALAT